MSRLDSFIRRLEAQRACLDWAVAASGDLAGVALELGLGNGRTYDHLRSRIGHVREIFAFDRQLAAHPGSIPDSNHLLLGDFSETLPELERRLGRTAVLVHADTGSGDSLASQTQARGLVPLIDPLLKLGAAVVSDQDMAPDPRFAWQKQPLPAGVSEGRYFLYRKIG